MAFVYVVFLPPDPESIALGESPWGSLVVFPSDGSGTFRTSTGINGWVTQIPVVTPLTPIPQPPTGYYIPYNQTPVNLTFSPGDDGSYVADLPDTGGEDADFFIEIPLDDTETPDTIPLQFTYENIKTNGMIGNPYVYTIKSGNLYRLDAATGDVLKTWESYNPVGVYSNSNIGVVAATSFALYYLNQDDNLVSFFSFTGDAFFGGFNEDGNFWWFTGGDIMQASVFDSSFTRINRTVFRDYPGINGYGDSDKSGGYYLSNTDHFDTPMGGE